MSSFLHSFVETNRWLCARVGTHLPQAETRIFAAYEETVSHYVNRKPNQIVVDVGGGARCGFARRCISSARIIAADLSPAELAHNRDASERVACDASRSMPFADASVDMVVSHCVIEHLKDVEGFLSETRRVLKPEGLSIHLFPAKHAPFSLINRLLPHRWSRALLFRLQPSQKSVGGFRAYYQYCSPRPFERLLRKHGFESQQTALSYFQSDYFNFFVPLFLASSAFELAAWAFDLRPLCAFVLSVAHKHPEPAESANTCVHLTHAPHEESLPLAR
jgi:ubiquinone/menaquinone biosynthesis C-methylase UbiE